MIEIQHLHARILEELDMSKEVEDEELTRIIYRILKEEGGYQSQWCWAGPGRSKDAQR